MARDAGPEEEFLQNTEDALARGTFGIPSYVVDGEQYWGQNRLYWVVRTLAAGAGE